MCVYPTVLSQSADPIRQTIAKSIEQYSLRLETLFLAEMFPRLEEGGLEQDVARPSAWITKARFAVQGDKKVEPFVFQASVSFFPHHPLPR